MRKANAARIPNRPAIPAAADLAQKSWCPGQKKAAAASCSCTPATAPPECTATRAPCAKAPDAGRGNSVFCGHAA